MASFPDIESDPGQVFFQASRAIGCKELCSVAILCSKLRFATIPGGRVLATSIHVHDGTANFVM